MTERKTNAPTSKTEVRVEQCGREVRLILISETLGNCDLLCKELRAQIESGFVSITLGGLTVLVER